MKKLLVLLTVIILAVIVASLYYFCIDHNVKDSLSMIPVVIGSAYVGDYIEKRLRQKSK